MFNDIISLFKKLLVVPIIMPLYCYEKWTGKYISDSLEDLASRLMDWAEK